MIRDHFHIFRHTDGIPRHLHVNLPDGAKIYILASGSTTVAQLLRAEAINMHICDGPRALPADQILLEQGAYGPCTIQVTQGVGLGDPFAQFAIAF